MCVLSANGTKVLCVFKLSRSGEDQKEKFMSLGNHQLLWHGTKMSNVIGILRNGLLVAPAEAPITGHIFGEVRKNRSIVFLAILLSICELSVTKGMVLIQSCILEWGLCLCTHWCHKYIIFFLPRGDHVEKKGNYLECDQDQICSSMFSS